MPNINRRSLITGLVSLIAAPAIIRAGSLMPIKSLLIDDWTSDFGLIRRPAADPEYSINFNSMGARPIFRQDGAPLQAGDLLLDQHVIVVFDGSRWVMPLTT